MPSVGQAMGKGCADCYLTVRQASPVLRPQVPVRSHPPSEVQRRATGGPAAGRMCIHLAAAELPRMLVGDGLQHRGRNTSMPRCTALPDYMGNRHVPCTAQYSHEARSMWCAIATPRARRPALLRQLPVAPASPAPARPSRAHRLAGSVASRLWQMLVSSAE